MTTVVTVQRRVTITVDGNTVVYRTGFIGQGDGPGGGVTLSDDDPQALAGSAVPGTGGKASRSDHVHPFPTPSDIGADTPSARDTAIGSAVATEATNRTAAIDAAAATLQDSIDGETSDRTDADTALGARIDTEATARADGDSTTLSDAEADAATKVAAEATARDAAIATAITNLVNGAPGALDTLKEIADKLAADDTALASILSTVGGKLDASSPRLVPDPTSLPDGDMAMVSSGLWVARTSSQVRTALGLGTAAQSATTDFDAAGAAAAAQAASQPLDSDLTAIAALATTVIGRSLLAAADAAALRAILSLGTLATQSGTFSGTSSGTNTGDQDLSGLVPTTRTLAGLDLSANRTAAALKTALAIVPGDVSGFDTQVRTSRLDQMAVPTADVSVNSHKLTNVTDPTSNQDAATKAYSDLKLQSAWVQRLRKSSDQTITNTTSLTDVSSLGFSVGANDEWMCEWVVLIGGPTTNTAGVDLAITVPSGATVTANLHGPRTSSSAPALLQTVPVASGSGTRMSFGNGLSGSPVWMAIVRAYVVNSTNAGTIQLQFSQTTGTASNLTIAADSHGIAFRRV